MTLKEILLLATGIIIAFTLLFAFIFLIIRRTLNKPPKGSREGDHYHESGLGDPGGSNLHDPTSSHSSHD